MAKTKTTPAAAVPPLSVDATLDFLRRYAPFNRMREEALLAFVPRLKLAVFAKDATILSTQSGPIAWLHIIQRGLVGSRPNNTQADPDRTLGPGELFPVGALSAGGTTTKVFYALQDTSCYLLARADFLELRQSSPEFERYCTQAITETLKQSLESLHSQYSQRVAEQQSLTRTLAELVRHPPVACAATATVREAGQKMADAKVRTIVALDPGGTPVGMFTLVDVLRRVVLPGLPLSTPLSAAMSTPLVTLPASATAYEAMHVMAERGVRQIAVVENGRLKGVVNERDLFALQRVSMRQVNEGLHSADTLDKLKRAGDDIRLLTQNLLAQGVGAEPLTRTIAALNDALSRRVIDLVLERHDLGDFAWCWLALGSEGRGEQTFATDQDNALLFSAADATEADAQRVRLIAFAREVNAALDTLGFPLCTGNVMASNAELCLSTEEWKAKFLAWIRAPTPQALLGANIVFDFRPLYGDTTLGDALREWLFGYTQANPMFLRLMVQNALEVEPPLGLIRTFAVDDDAAVKGTIDLKTRGTRLFVDCARVFALAHGIADTGTVARIRLAGARLHVAPRHIDATVEAFHFLQLLRLRQQDRVGGSDPNRIDPYALHDIDQRMLKEALRQARQLQERLRLSYRL
jgi:CBS domain-containing protein